MSSEIQSSAKAQEDDAPTIKKDLNGNPDKKENTRSKIALIYVIAFFLTILAVFIIGCILHLCTEDFKDMLITVSGVLSGPLGFIVGYYFKASKE